MSEGQEFTIFLRKPTLGLPGKAVLRASVGAALLLGWVTAAPGQYTRNPLRSITGKVEDHGKEPLRGAVVQVEAEDTMVIESYVTNERGEYHFHNLRPDADYRVWATFRNHRSKSHEVSKFERKPDQVVQLIIDLDKD